MSVIPSPSSHEMLLIRDSRFSAHHSFLPAPFSSSPRSPAHCGLLLASTSGSQRFPPCFLWPAAFSALLLRTGSRSFFYFTTFHVPPGIFRQPAGAFSSLIPQKRETDTVPLPCRNFKIHITGHFQPYYMQKNRIFGNGIHIIAPFSPNYMYAAPCP